MSTDSAPRHPPRDQFLSEEDLDLRNCSWEELCLWWDHWLRAAQAWNDDDEDEYAHGVFAIPRREWPAEMRGDRGARRDPRKP